MPSHRHAQSEGPPLRLLLVVLAVAMLCQVLPLVTGAVGDRSGSLFGDEVGYWDLSGGKLRSFLRPPGYPSVVWALRAIFGDSLLAVFWAQSLVASAAPVLVLLLAWGAGVRSRAALLVAGFGSATSLTAISLSKRLLADSLVAILLMSAMLALIRARRRNSRIGLVLSGLLAGLALLVKPVAQLWLVVAPVAVRAGGWRGRRLLRGVVPTLLPVIGLLGVGAAMNLIQYGRASFSGIGTLALVRYWAPATEGLKENGGRWDTELFEQLRDEKWTPQDVLADAPQLERFSSLNERAVSLVRSEPSWAARALVGAAWRNLPRPYFPQELFFHSEPPSWQVVGGKTLTYVLWLAAGLGAVRGLLVRALRAETVACLVFAGFLIAATAISWGEGARLMFPAEWALFVFAGITAEWVSRGGAGASDRG